MQFSLLFFKKITREKKKRFWANLSSRASSKYG